MNPTDLALSTSSHTYTVCVPGSDFYWHNDYLENSWRGAVAAAMDAWANLELAVEEDWSEMP